MSSEETLIQVRKDKHQQINGGTYPLAKDPWEQPFITHTSIEQVQKFIGLLRGSGKLIASVLHTELGEADKYIIRGRISALRKSGAITFIRLTDISGSLQIIVSKSSYLEYDSIKLLDLGDIIEVGGRACQSKTGEDSLLAFSIVVLTKAHRPPPEKFAGIADQELKYRKRYLDLMSSEETRARFIVRTYVLRAIREYMDKRSFLEVETPTLGAIASGANAKPFVTHHNALDADMRLRIAPELYLKRLLVGGMERVYEIGRNYRNEGIDTRHNPEFTMMESYQAYGNFSQLVKFTEQLIQHVVSYLGMNLPSVALPFFKKWQEEATYDIWRFTEVYMSDAISRACTKAELSLSCSSCELFCGGCFDDDVHRVNIENYNNERMLKIDMKALHNDIGNATTPGEKWYALFEHVAEPFLTEDYRNESGSKSLPILIKRFPTEVSPLARADDWRSFECDRFELFVDGRELANAFQELNDPEEQAVRLKEQLVASNKDPMDFDADYVEALEHGMPPAIGFGIGIDRLVMLLTNTSSIKDVILFPTLKPEK
jgi:lysyl-tRNA synthetase, class II